MLGFRAVELLLHHGHAHSTVHPAVVMVLAGTEVVSAILFVIPKTRDAGGFALLGVLVAATVLHLFVRETPSLDFLVYGSGIWVVLRAVPGAGKGSEPAHDSVPSAS